MGYKKEYKFIVNNPFSLYQTEKLWYNIYIIRKNAVL